MNKRVKHKGLVKVLLVLQLLTCLAHDTYTAKQNPSMKLSLEQFIKLETNEHTSSYLPLNIQDSSIQTRREKKNAITN